MNKKWKLLFFLLLGANLSIVVFFLVFVLSPAKEDSLPRTTKENKEEMVSFVVGSNKSDLTRVINYYIEEETDDSAIDYEVLLTDEVELYGIIEVFTQEIELKMTFEPEALENGNLLLKQKSMSIGSLPLPVEYVLKFVKEQYALPDWVEIYPEEKNVYVALMDMETKNGIQLGASRFDLKNDDISFILLMPGKDGY